jgi:hypothetical protein
MYRSLFLLLLALVACKGQPAQVYQPPTSSIVDLASEDGGTLRAKITYGAGRSNWNDYEDLGTDASGVVKATPGVVGGLYALNNNTATRYVQLFDSSSAPTNGATPKLQWAIPAGGGGEIIVGSDFFSDEGVAFNSAGIAWGISTTKGTFTAATPGDHDFMAVWR